MTAYRPDIDGLRALAVTAVVLYHLHPRLVPAGLLGVDVFFVISGYLITAQLLASRGQPLSALLLDFYARRVRRILPSLATVVIATLVLARLFLLPGVEQRDFAESAIATALFASNVFFWGREQNYFSRDAELQPLLHTWSLAVEEQFYLFWPLVLAALWMLARRLSRWRADVVVLAGVAVISLLSLALSIVWTIVDPGAAFYLTPSRFWELESGAALAMILATPGRPRLPVFAGLAGLAAIVASFFLYTRDTPFPGVAAVLPVAGAALLIAAGSERKAGPTYRLFTWRPLIVTGEISYSWYLWHWPLLAIARADDLGRRDLGRDSALVLLAYLLAYLSTRFLETPIRQRRIALFSKPRISLVAGFSLLSLMLLLSVPLWISARAVDLPDTTTASNDCQDQGDLIEESCILAQGDRAHVFLVGDSHASHWAPVIADWASTTGARVIGRFRANCVPFLESRRAEHEIWQAHDQRDCIRFSRLAMAEIERSAVTAKPTAAVLSMDWYFYSAAEKPERQLLAGSLDEALTAVEDAGASVLIIGPTPRFEYMPVSCLARLGGQACNVARGRHIANNMAVYAMLREVVARHPRVRIWDPTAAYCDAGSCYSSRDGKLLFADQSHLTESGAQIAVPHLLPQLDWLLLPGS